MNFTFATLNLLNYVAPPNACYEFHNIYDSEQWQKKQQWIAKQIEQVRPDIIAFQEVFSSEELKQQVLKLGYPHFATVTDPTIEEEYLYTAPVVAIASRYPLDEVCAVDYPSNLTQNQQDYRRQPLRATITLPELGTIDVYIVHFKSQRPMDNALNLESNDTTSLDQWQQACVGRWLSTIQRGWECHLLYHSIVERKKQTAHPVVLMGDFNQSLANSELAALNIHAHPRTDEPTQIAPYQLIDAGAIWFHEEPWSRPATHYHGANGNVLDYILLSWELHGSSDFPRAELVHYQVLDKHLVNPNFDDDAYASDHAVVSLTLKATL